jgi:non-ribosomal peptide synthetase component F
MLAALASLVYRYGGHRVVPLLVPVDTRRAGDEGRCGAFTTSLPVIAEVDGDASFTAMVEALRDRFEDTKAQAGYPFRLLMDTVDIESGELRPLTQVGARYVQRPRIEAQIGDLRIALERQRSTRADVDLQLEVFDHGDALEAGFNHSTELFGGGTIARIAGHFRTLLAFHLENPAERVDDAQVLTAAEERQIRYLWNRTEVPFNDDATVHGLMEMAASAYPGPIAVSYADQQLTYGEFNAAANRVAHRLRAPARSRCRWHWSQYSKPVRPMCRSKPTFPQSDSLS